MLQTRDRERERKKDGIHEPECSHVLLRYTCYISHSCTFFLPTRSRSRSRQITWRDIKKNNSIIQNFKTQVRRTTRRRCSKMQRIAPSVEFLTNVGIAWASSSGRQHCNNISCREMFHESIGFQYVILYYRTNRS